MVRNPVCVLWSSSLSPSIQVLAPGTHSSSKSLKAVLCLAPGPFHIFHPDWGGVRGRVRVFPVSNTVSGFLNLG
ncbi:mCG1051073 [Mus musculus]|nr:mCG1051073 [Mus musculus]